MENLLKIVTECPDRFSGKSGTKRLAAIIGGEAVILHGIPGTTIDSDVLLHFRDRFGVTRKSVGASDGKNRIIIARCSSVRSAGYRK